MASRAQPLLLTNRATSSDGDRRASPTWGTGIAFKIFKARPRCTFGCIELKVLNGRELQHHVKL